MLQNYVKWLLRYPWWVVMFGLSVTYLASQGLPFANFKNDTPVLIDKQTPQIVGFDAQQNPIGFEENILLLLSPKNGDVFTAQNLAIAKNLSENLRQTPFMIRVDSLTNFFTSIESGHTEQLDQLIYKASQLNARELAKIKQATLAEPTLIHHLVSADYKTLGFNVIVQMPDGPKSREQTEKSVSFVRKLANDLTAVNPDMVVQLSGSIMIQKAFGESSELDLKILSPTMLVIIAIALWFFLHSFINMIATMSLIASAIVITAGLTGWLSLSFSTASLSALYVMIAIAIADAVHLLTSYSQSLVNGLPKYNALQKSLADNFTAIFISHFAIGVGFFMLGVNSPTSSQDLGNIAVIGVVVTFFMAITFLPALLYLLPVSNLIEDRHSLNNLQELAHYINKNRHPLSLILLILTLVLIT